MILRRIIESLKNQDVGTLIAEVVVVVVGIFIGLQVDDWNEARKDRTRANAYLGRIATDLEADLSAIENRTSFWRDVSEYGAKGLTYAETGEAGGATQWDILVAFFQASQVDEFVTSQATYEELKSAGELGLISDLDLRGGLTDYYNFRAVATITELPAYREHVRGTIPLDVQLYLWDNCYASNPLGKQEMLNCASPIDEARAKEIVDALVSDAALMEELRYWMSTMHVASLIGRDRKASAIALHALTESARSKE